MGNIKNSQKRKSKKVFRGNNHTIIKKSRANDEGNYFSNNENPESTRSSARPTDFCIKAEKVRQSDEEYCNIFISSLILKEMFEQVGKCKQCNSFATFSLDLEKKQGFAVPLLLSCTECDLKWTCFSSKKG